MSDRLRECGLECQGVQRIDTPVMAALARFRHSIALA